MTTFLDSHTHANYYELNCWPPKILLSCRSDQNLFFGGTTFISIQRMNGEYWGLSWTVVVDSRILNSLLDFGQ